MENYTNQLGFSHNKTLLNDSYFFYMEVFSCLFISNWSTVFSLHFLPVWFILSLLVYSCVWTSVSPTCPFYSFPTSSAAPLSLSATLLCLSSPHYPSSSSGGRCLTRSPWSSRVRWRGSWVWWTTCRALSATTTRCRQSPASTALTRRSITSSETSHDSLHSFHFNTSYFSRGGRNLADWFMKIQCNTIKLSLKVLVPNTIGKGPASSREMIQE